MRTSRARCTRSFASPLALDGTRRDQDAGLALATTSARLGLPRASFSFPFPLVGSTDDSVPVTASTSNSSISAVCVFVFILGRPVSVWTPGRGVRRGSATVVRSSSRGCGCVVHRHGSAPIRRITRLGLKDAATSELIARRRKGPAAATFATTASPLAKMCLIVTWGMVGAARSCPTRAEGRIAARSGSAPTRHHPIFFCLRCPPMVQGRGTSACGRLLPLQRWLFLLHPLALLIRLLREQRGLALLCSLALLRLALLCLCILELLWRGHVLLCLLELRGLALLRGLAR
eukprot:scaffold317021_cov31-Tisochrysis_lutea.AAC.4